MTVDAIGSRQERGDGWWRLRSLEVVDDPRVRIERLVPLLHELVACGLVLRAHDGGFVLRADVQERLASLTIDRPERTADVFVGRRCEHCGLVALTWLHDGLRTCSACSQERAAAELARPAGEAPATPSAAPTGAGAPSRWRSGARRHRTAS